MSSVIIDADYVIYRLQEAGKTLLALPGGVGPAKLGAQTYGYVSDVIAAAPVIGRVRIAPSRDAIARMDEALPWLAYISNATRRRIVAARSLVSPSTDKHLFSWRDIAKAVGASHEAMRGWHLKGVAEIVGALNT